MIDKCGCVFLIASLLPEDRLAAVGVAGPFVEREHAGERIKVTHAVESGSRKVIEDLSLERSQHEAGAQGESMAAGDTGGAYANAQVRSVFDEP